MSMNVRNRLVELLKKTEINKINGHTALAEVCFTPNVFENMATNLISHGVTVQEEAKLYWKPVKPGEWNLTCSACDSHLGCKENASFCPECGAKFVYPKAVMPQPPKGE